MFGGLVYPWSTIKCILIIVKTDLTPPAACDLSMYIMSVLLTAATLLQSTLDEGLVSTQRAGKI